MRYILIPIFYLISLTLFSKVLLAESVNVDQEETSESIVLSFEDLLSLSTRLMQSEDMDQAYRLLQQLKSLDGDNPEVLFRLGLISVYQKNFEQSVYYFEKILVNQPDAVRVRLELARSLFELRRYTQSEREFRFARSGDLPESVYSNIDRYLAAIQYYQTLRWNFSLSLAPDDNINTAPDIVRIGPGGSIELDGFEKSSGLGFLVNTGVEWLPRLNQTTRLRLGTNLYHTDYSGSSFDDTILSYHIGPRFDINRMSVSTLLTGYKRWYQHAEYSDVLGARVEMLYRLSSRLRTSVVLDYQDISYKNNSRNDGYRKGFRGIVDYALSESSGIQLSGGYFREISGLGFNSSDTYRFGVGYYRELMHGINVFVQPEYNLTKYHETDPFLTLPILQLGSDKRKDETYRLNVSLSNRQWHYRGFTPTLLFIHSQRKSNFELFDYSRNQVQLGVRKIF